MYSLINLGSLIYGEYEYNKTIMEGIGQDLGSKNNFVSLTRVSQRLVNDCTVNSANNFRNAKGCILLACERTCDIFIT